MKRLFYFFLLLSDPQQDGDKTPRSAKAKRIPLAGECGVWYDGSMPDDVYYAPEFLLNPETPWLLPLIFALFGACVGSFLNVVIYRVPRGMSVNEPRRSFCPACKAPIPWYHNVPLISWLLLRGRSACCHTRIPVRYWLVELACTLLFAGIAHEFGAETLPTLILLCIWCALMLVMLCVDWELMVVQVGFAVAATAAGLAVAALSPWLVDADGQALEASTGLMWSAAGGIFGFLLLKAVSLLGKLLFGRRQKAWDSPVAWSLRQAGEDLELSVGGDCYKWSELFMEASNQLELTAATLPEQGCHEAGNIIFSIDSVTLPDGKRIALEECEYLSGTCSGMHTFQEAMGSGDAWLALAIGALCGWQGVLFALVAGSVLGIIWALIARVGRGTPIPFGPVFIAGAYIWLFFSPLIVGMLG